MLILDPMYGEYAHVLERVTGCRVDRFQLSRERHYDVDCDALADALRSGYDCVILVNPNSPTGRHIARQEMQALLATVPRRTRVWIDETYVEYAGPFESLESFAVASSNVVICKSMSKVYALSGVRAAYLCGPVPLVEELRAITPPWAVSLPAQIAAIEALRSGSYYGGRWAETHRLRERLATDLATLGWSIVPGCANFLLCHLPQDQPEATVLIDACRRQRLFLRNVASMSSCFDARTVRIAVKDAATNAAMLGILREVLAGIQRSAQSSEAA